ncbi:MAG: methyltransferase domain-containing protein [Rubricoccaceae bacterium]|nr:methyltransferase domain-containing protein [Rubricoccaceae bacterium]
MIRSRYWYRVPLVALTVLLVLSARTPEDGAGWRIAFVCTAFAVFLAVLWIRTKWEITFREVVLVALILRLVAFPLLPTLSDDGYRYVWDGMVQSQEGINPYQFKPANTEIEHLQSERLYELLNSRSFYSVYPPASQIAFAVGGFVYPFGWQASWFLIKLLLLVCELGAVVLLARLVSAKTAVLYAWHPLAVLEIAGQAHSEALLLLFVMVAVWGSRSGYRILAGAAMALAGWVKLVPLFAVPGTLKHLKLSGVVSLALVSLAVVAPYLAGYTIPNVRESLELYIRYFEFNAGPYFSIKELASASLGDISKQLGPIFQLCFLLSVVGISYRALQRNWSIEVVLFAVFSLFFLFATTVHPWYLLPLLILSALLLEKRRELKWLTIGWIALATISIGTYVTYVGAETGYWLFVILGWTAFFLCACAYSAERVLPILMRRRARWKWDLIVDLLPERITTNDRVLDLGGGDGYVAERIATKTGAHVMMADVVDYNKTTIPVSVYDGDSIPFDQDTFDLTLLVFVLHHAENAERVIQEAVRVSADRVVVVESVYESSLQRWLLTNLDKFANAVRSNGAIRSQEEFLSFRTDREWRNTFLQLGLTIERAVCRGTWFHRQVFYVLRKSDH